MRPQVAFGAAGAGADVGTDADADVDMDARDGDVENDETSSSNLAPQRGRDSPTRRYTI